MQNPAADHAPPDSPAARAQLDLLKRLTAIPTASGRESRVAAFVRAWVSDRPALRLTQDPVGNLVIAFADAPPAGRQAPLMVTAHTDHPAFVVERVIGPGTVEVSFRGGVMDAFFDHAPIRLITADDRPIDATLTGKAPSGTPAGAHYTAELRSGGTADVRVGDIGLWPLDDPRIDRDGLLHAPACDDLAGAAAALCMLDALLAHRAAGPAQPQAPSVRVLLTRAEEIGFLGAIAACKHGTIPAGARVIALENSPALPEAPVGAGPIVRVGDRISVFTPWLTAACAARAEEALGRRSVPWQRRLMTGGACEASVFCRAGLDATCLCLPLGNYHNMPHLAQLRDGTYDAARLGPPRAAHEFIHTRDYLGLVELLFALALSPPEPGLSDGPSGERFERLYAERAYVLSER
ncbi:MAG: hypothetical protein C0475_06375 [Planctomyces sp.]|nr:hypothetical protein [Planctomyces sp.]